MMDFLNATPDEKLAYTIAYSLSRSPFALKRGNADDVLKIIARDIIKHMKESGWSFEHKSSMYPPPALTTSRVTDDNP